MIEVHYRRDGDSTIVRLKGNYEIMDGVIIGHTEDGKWMAIKDWLFACEVNDDKEVSW